MPTLTIDAQDFENDKAARALIDASARNTIAALFDVSRNDPSHNFGTVDDCVRCIDCEVLFGGSQSGSVCPAYGERLRIGPAPISDDWADELPADFVLSGRYARSEIERAYDDGHARWETDGGR